MTGSLDFDAFLARRELRRAVALQAADRLLCGAFAQDLLPSFGEWRFAAHGPVGDRLAAALLERLPRPSPAAIAAHLLPGSELPQHLRNAPMSEREHHLRVEAACAATLQATPHLRLAWALAELQLRATQLRAMEARWWTPLRYRVDAALDAEITGCWAALLSHRPWAAMGLAGRILLPVVRRVARDFFEAREVPTKAQRLHLAFLEENFFGRLIADDGVGGGRMELAVRTMETTGQGHFDALLTLLPEAGASVLAGALSRSKSALCAADAWVGGCRGWLARGALLRELLEHDLSTYAALAEVNLVQRLIRAWAVGGAKTSAAGGDTLISRNLRRWTGRLRATVLYNRPAMEQRLLEIEAPAARTLAALRRYTYAWLWDELHRGFPWSPAEPVTKRIGLPRDKSPAPIGVEHTAAVSTWVCRALLRLDLEELTSWVRGGVRPRCSHRLDELLLSLPPELTDHPLGEGRNSYHRLRAFLCPRLVEIVRSWRQGLGALAQLDPTARGLSVQAWAILAPDWNPAIVFPKKGFPKMICRVRKSLSQLDLGLGGVS